ncbi:MAG: hypothetical protein HY245_08335 [Rhizobiales bacterium]|nr:hypothetical protein [Hyphomicrobiales bacterium]MBI3673411.1 hypothetical protein [Hyphomicrobiales bacterium]
MRRAGLIVNPRSGKSSGKGLALAEKLKSAPRVLVRVLDDFASLSTQLDDMAMAGVTDLFISSGDGTVHAIQTELAERRPFQRLPRLALLPHGTTNMTAADLGFRRRGLDAQADFLETLPSAELRDRPTVRVINPADGRPRHGMCVGTGASAEATLFIQRMFNSKGHKGGWPIFATVGGMALRAMFTSPAAGDTSRIDRPYDIAVEAEGRPISAGPHLLMLATTLDKLVLNMRPFWGGKAGGPIRLTVVSYPLASVMRWLLPMMYGSEDRSVPPGAISVATSSLAVWSKTSFVLDGEFFFAPENEPLRVETGPVFSYVCG